MTSRIVSIDETWKRAGGRPSGFDYLRLVLSISIICFHSIITCYGAEAEANVINGKVGWVFNLILPMFFSLSGFLVAGSLLRSSSIVRFLWLRALRIYPALFFDTFISAFVLGALVTTLPLDRYYQSTDFYRYLLNVIGLIHYYLPGVFDRNPVSMVNGQLWTIPYELECYLALAALAAFFVKDRIRRISVAIVTLYLVSAVLYGFVLNEGADEPVRTLVPGRVLVICFLMGVLFYFAKERLPISRLLFAASLLFFAYTVIDQRWVYFCPLPAIYVTTFVGLSNFRRIKLIQGTDLSYGLFLFGYPIQQLVVYLFPICSTWYWNIFISIPLTALLAWISWSLVEKRALSYKAAF